MFHTTFLTPCCWKMFSTWCHIWTYCAGVPALPFRSVQLVPGADDTSFCGSCHTVRKTFDPTELMFFAAATISASTEPSSTCAQVVAGFQLMSTILPLAAKYASGEPG